MDAWTTLSTAADLPIEWDDLSKPHYILHRDFLLQLEKAHPCGQLYHLFFYEGKLDSILVSYRTRMNLMLYTPFELYLDFTIFYPALPLSCRGFVIGERTQGQVEDFIRAQKGLCMLINWRSEEKLADMAISTMNPSVSMTLPWKTFDEYLANMRRYYRRRCNKALRRGKDLEFEFLDDNAQFDERLYGYYRYIYDNSLNKLELLPIAYFRSGIGKLLVCKHEGKSVGFIQLIHNGKEMVAALIGYDQELNIELDIYHNLQLQSIKYAIKMDCEVMEMGQTAEDAKLKYGGRYTPLNVLLRHSNPFWRVVIRFLMPYCSYKTDVREYRVFKTDSNQETLLAEHS